MNTPTLTPAQRIAQRAQLSAVTTPAPTETEDEELPASPLSIFPPNSNTIGRRPLSTLAQQLKEEHDLDFNSCAEVDKYCGMTLEERLLVHFVIGLKQREILKKKTGTEQYTIPSALLTTLRGNAFSLFMSSKLTSYTGKLAKATIEASREIGVPELPAVHELGKLGIIEKQLKKHITDIRYQTKEKISKSLKVKKKPDVAMLTAKLIGDKSVPITAAMYRRVAVLRFVAVSHPEQFKSDEYWAKVDEVIHSWREAANGNAGVLLNIFDQTYKEDQILEKHAAKIKYNHPTKPGKRRRVEESEDEVEDDEQANQSVRGTPVPEENEEN
ncbi:hypothetical protein K435DRAFT_799837 [Dendrothele bispora CBS 962.96]|uniref:Uncharacterized protein n=1 Tax=Dendrothele bispora (strain CBS 962.96) TaxID=1314807 RepID=A0A4S8LV08_DENBC|nr:hypothetical protein K435DRAFT_799837 [Dendrothele bispora CBS 962.96]